MDILTALLALLSCALIGTGVWLVLRDVRRVQAHRMASATPHAQAGGEGGSGSPAQSPDARMAAASITPSPADAGQATARAAFTQDAGASASQADARSEPSRSLDEMLDVAIRAVNGAFEPAGIALHRVQMSSQARDGEAAEGGVLVRLQAGGGAVGHLRIDHGAEDLEITALSTPGGHEQLRRVRRLALEDLTIPGLAEAVAACAWPIASSALGHTKARP